MSRKITKTEKQGIKIDRKGKTIEEFYGKERAEDIRNKMSLSRIGKPSWNKGLTKENDKRVRISAEKHSKTKKGLFKENKLSIWSKGLTKETDERVKKLSSNLRGIRRSEESKQKLSNFRKGKTYEEILGKQKSEEVKMKLSRKFLGINNPLYGKNHTNKTIKKLREIRAKQILPIKDTSIEIKIQNFLSLLHIEYYTHKYMKIEHGYQCDIFIPKQEGITQKTVIECDGCYWHGCPICKSDSSNSSIKQKERDEIRTKELRQQRFKVIRLWEHEIRPMRIDDFKGVLNA